ncbi:beethoven [Carabus blaptoides fortunei]
MKIHTIDLPEKEDLQILCESYMSAIIKLSLPNNSVWDVKGKLSKLVHTLISIFDEIKNSFTVLQQRHYLFSPHDLTKWCTGLKRYNSVLMASPSDSENIMFEILCYEAHRIFSDKLVCEDDRKKVDSIVNKMFQMQWGKSTILSNLKDSYYVPAERFSNNQEILPLTRLNAEDWINLVKKGILHYEREGQILNLLILPELLSMTSSLARCLTQPSGCALLAGRSGVGRHSSLRIISALQSAKLITPISETISQFKIDLKSAMQIAGIEGDQVYFLLEDHMMRNLAILDLVNTLLAAGEVPGLYTTSELDSLVVGLKDEADSDNFDGNTVQYFVQRIRNNLHVVICLEVDSVEFWRILENYPVFHQRCTIIWQSEWSPDSMVNVPNLLLQKITEKNFDEKLTLDIPEGFYNIHKQAKNALVTPQNVPRFATALELAIRFGKVLIIEEIDNVPPILFPILRKEFIHQGERRLILLGNKFVDYHNDFCLYLCSRHEYLNIPSDLYAVLSIVNFTTTNAGLTEQLLGAAIRQETPKLESRKNELLQKQEELQEQQSNLQSQLLEELANATGDILQNKPLLNSLNETKASSIAIATSLTESSKIQEQLQRECDSIIHQCVLHLTGLKKLSPRVVYLSQLFKETTSSEPILLITAPGADPSTELRDLATHIIGAAKYREISMGEGQESLALQELENSAKQGHWICLKNLHLSCTKLAYEAPSGIRNNLLRSYVTWGKDFVEKQNATGARLIFLLAYVHALLQERRIYVPQGWTKYYEFSDVDLYTAAHLSEEIWGSMKGNLLWAHMKGLCADAIYGGRVDDHQDEKIMLSYLTQNFNDTVLSHKWKLTGMTNSFPNNSNYQDYTDCINQLSEVDNPSYFGLPANIDCALQKNISMKLTSTLKVLELPKVTKGVEKEEWHRGISPLLTFWKKLNKGQDWLRVSIPPPTNEGTIITTFMYEEKKFAIELIQGVHRSLSTISKVTRGAALPTEKDTEIVNSLLAYQTPNDCSTQTAHSKII